MYENHQPIPLDGQIKIYGWTQQVYRSNVENSERWLMVKD